MSLDETCQGVFMFNKNIFGIRMKELRKLKKLTLNDVATELNAKHNTLSNIERGVRAPSLDMAIAIAYFFNVSLDYLLGATDFPTPIPDNIKQILEQTNNPDEIMTVINKSGENKDESKIKKMIDDLDEDSMDELVKYINYLKVRQALSPTNNDSSAGLDIKEIK